MGNSDFSQIWTNSDQLLTWLFGLFQTIYNLIISNWIFNILFTLGILGLVIALFSKLLGPLKNTKRKN